MQEHKEELVEIKADLLKFCPYMFVFEFNNTEFAFEYILNSHAFCRYLYNDSVEKWSTGNTVLVNSQDYERAVMAKIKEMIDFGRDTISSAKVVKVNGSVHIEFVPSHAFKLVILPINADPRPWEESYTIEIGEKYDE